MPNEVQDSLLGLAGVSVIIVLDLIALALRARLSRRPTRTRGA